MTASVLAPSPTGLEVSSEVNIETNLFEGYGCVVFANELGQFMVRYESGEAAGSGELKVAITAEEFAKLKRSERDAYEVLLSKQSSAG